MDIMPNGMAGDGPDNQRNNAGEAHAVSGAMIAQYLAPVATAVAAGEEATPSSFALGDVYPNPFNSTATIPFGLERPGAVMLAVYDLAGQHVATLVSGEQPAGSHVARWDGSDGSGRQAASGVYVARLTLGEIRRSSKLLLLR